MSFICFKTLHMYLRIYIIYTISQDSSLNVILTKIGMSSFIVLLDIIAL